MSSCITAIWWLRVSLAKFSGLWRRGEEEEEEEEGGGEEEEEEEVGEEEEGARVFPGFRR